MIDLIKLPVVIPDLRNELRVLPTMGSSKRIPEIYNKAYGTWEAAPSKEQRDAATPEEIVVMLTQWFFRGLSQLRFNMKAEATTCNDKEFGAFVRMILSSFEPPHEHKMAFLVWTIHVCCDSVTYQVKS